MKGKNAENVMRGRRNEIKMQWQAEEVKAKT